MADDLERRAIIAAHDAECSDRCEATAMPSLSKREQAIVARWRVTEAGRLDEKAIANEAMKAAAKEQQRAEVAEAAIERVLARCETAGSTQPPFGQPVRTLTVAEIRAALDRTEVTDG